MLINLLIAMAAGGLGALIGGTQTFIMTGFVGIISAVFVAVGQGSAFFDTQVVNQMFLPAIIFNGDVVATAYAAKHYDIRGHETNRSLAFTKDSKVILMGCLGGLLGFLVYSLAVYLKLPCDQGSVAVILVGILTRVLLGQERKINPDGLKFIEGDGTPDSDGGASVWSFHILMALIAGLAMGYFVKATQLYTIGFSISAVTLIFGLTDPHFPATHHITLVAGYCVQATGNVFTGAMFAIIAELINLVFGEIFNNECGTHLDPPAVAIFICSLIIFTLL